MTRILTAERLTLRTWRVDDAPAALEIYGDADVVARLIPAMDQVRDLAAMCVLLQQWIAEDARLAVPAGRWAIEHDGHVVGVAFLLPLPPGDEDLEIGWPTSAEDAVVLAARRQRSTELTLHDQQEIAERAEYDASEPRITELYTKAADQLGSGRARSACLVFYALARLGETAEPQRQTTANQTEALLHNASFASASLFRATRPS